MKHHTIGTTSAYAENTTKLCATLRLSRNYLRVRGEYVLAIAYAKVYVELPPRTRRILGGVP